MSFDKKEYDRLYRIKNKSKRIEYVKNNKDKFKIYNDKYRKNNKKEFNLRTKVAKEQKRLEYAKFLTEIKNKPCKDCKKTFHTSAMDFDHLPENEKRFCIYEGSYIPRDVVLKEIDKCDLVCANCHMIRTYNRAKKHNKGTKLAQYIRNKKHLKPCIDCKIVYEYYLLQYDHVPERGDKVFNLSSIIKGTTKQQIDEEIAKCDIVCICCHRIRTYNRTHTL